MRTALLFVLFLTLGCQPQEQLLPVSLELAAQIIIDVHTAENAALPLYGARKDSIVQVYYRQICSIHQIDSVTLRQLISTIRNEPAISQQVYRRAGQLLDERYPDVR